MSFSKTPRPADTLQNGAGKPDAASPAAVGPHCAVEQPLGDLALAMLRLDTQPRPEAAPTQPAAVLELVERMGWMIGLRWRAVAMITAVIVIAIALGVVSDGTMLLALAATHAIGNVGFRRMATALAATESRERLENFLGAQILFDLIILMALLHFSGGADNPFMMLSVFHMAFAGMLLPIRKALFIGLCTGALYATMVLAEGSGLLAFHALRLGAQAGPPGAPGVPTTRSQGSAMRTKVPLPSATPSVIMPVTTIAWPPPDTATPTHSGPKLSSSCWKPPKE